MRPEIARSVVDLPAPLEPSKVTTAPSSISERESAQRFDLPVVDAEVGHCQERHHADSQIRRDDVGLREHVGRFPVRDAPAEIEHRQMLRHARDQGHVVVDDDDGEALGGYAVEQVVQRLLFAGVKAGGGLVEQQDRGVRRQRARDLDETLMAITEARDRLVGAARPARRSRARRARVDGARRVTACDERIAAAFGADHDIFQRGHRAEQANVLERAREASDGALVRGERGHVDAVDENCARRRTIEPGHHIERRRLSAAVRADQPMQAAAPHLKIDSVDGHQPAEILGEAPDLERDGRARIGGMQSKRLGRFRREALAGSEQPPDEAPDAVGHEDDDENDRGSVDREIKAGHALEEIAAIPE